VFLKDVRHFTQSLFKQLVKHTDLPLFLCITHPTNPPRLNNARSVLHTSGFYIAKCTHKTWYVADQYVMLDFGFDPKRTLTGLVQGKAGEWRIWTHRLHLDVYGSHRRTLAIQKKKTHTHTQAQHQQVKVIDSVRTKKCWLFVICHIGRTSHHYIQ
jgi:hypothetical protein